MISCTISPGDPRLLTSDHNYNDRRLNAYYDRPDDNWNQDNGFAFGAGNSLLFLSLLHVGRVLF